MKQFPSKEQILEWIEANPGQSSKRDIAKAFQIRGAAKVELKRVLTELAADGQLSRGPRKQMLTPGSLPPVTVLRVTGTDEFGEPVGEPVTWDGEADAPRVNILERPKDAALGTGDRVLVKISGDPERGYDGRVIRKIGSGPKKMLGIFRQEEFGGRVQPVDKKETRDWMIQPGDRNAARDGELVEAEQLPGSARMGLPKARIVARLGDPSAPKQVSLIAIHEHGIADDFPQAVVDEAKAAQPVLVGARTDLRDLPLLTIDPEDARDHDDAICALRDDDPANAGGFLVWVAIADVSYYVRAGSELDREARKRGNSTYFPDRVVPMLPDALSGDLCSLHEGVDRPCIALRMKLDATGKRLGHEFFRAMMHSPASLSYEQAQAADNGHFDAQTTPLKDALNTLFDAYRAAAKARDRRQPLNLDLPERRVILGEDGRVESIRFRDRFDAHKLVEEFMVLSNVCAAETLEAKRQPVMYRVHEEPNPEKLNALREMAQSSGFNLAKGQVLKTQHFNQLLDQAAGSEHAEQINLGVLRSMMQAYYAPENFGHFGLAVRRYAHFTSPIRRYADLLVHRALISAHGWGEDGLSAFDVENMDATAEAISNAERRSMLAERDTVDRYLASYMSDRIGAEFEGTVSGIARFGLFVKLDDSGADGLIPISRLGNEYFHHDAEAQQLIGERTRRVIGLGMRARVKLLEAAPLTGGLLLELLELEGKSLPKPRGRGGKPSSKPRNGPIGKRKPAAKPALAKAKIKRNRKRG